MKTATLREQVVTMATKNSNKQWMEIPCTFPWHFDTLDNVFTCVEIHIAFHK